MGRVINFAIYVVCLVGLAASADLAVSALTASPAPLTGLAGSLARSAGQAMERRLLV